MPDHKTALRLAGMEGLEIMARDGETILIAREQAALEQGKERRSKQTGYFTVETSARRKRGIAINLPDAIIDATKHPPQKICGGPDCPCKGFPQSLAMFGPDPDSRDGHQSRCHPCESKRVNLINQRKARDKKAAAARKVEEEALAKKGRGP
jgi:hypothetical protein